MSFIRGAVTARTLVRGVRFNSSQAAPQKSNSNLALYLTGAGALGLGAYAYTSFGGESAAPKAAVQEKSPLDPKNWVNFKLKKVEPYNHNTAKFVLELPDNQASLMPITSCVYLRAANPDDLVDDKGKPVIRPYTPISTSDAKGEFVFLIKKYDTGVASKYIHTLKEGDSLAVKGPIPKLAWKTNEFEQVGMVAGGSGITPMYQLLVHALRDKENKTKFKLIYANVSEGDILLKQEFEDLKKKYPDTFDVIYTLDKPSKGWTGPSGYVNAELIKKHFASPDLKEKVKVFVCGPPPQMEALAGDKAGRDQGEFKGILKQMGYTQEQVFKF